MFQWD